MEARVPVAPSMSSPACISPSVVRVRRYSDQLWFRSPEEQGHTSTVPTGDFVLSPVVFTAGETYDVQMSLGVGGSVGTKNQQDGDGGFSASWSNTMHWRGVS